MRRQLLGLAEVLVLGWMAAQAQQTSVATGSVEGMVSDARTRLPLRFAQVRLVPRPTEVSQTEETDALKAGQVQRQEPRVGMVEGITGMDGNFRMERVPEGEYFAAAYVPGYVQPGESVAFAPAVPEAQLRALIEAVPVVRVKAGQGATVPDLMLRRGAVISGRLRFADGSPAIGTRVVLEEAQPPAYDKNRPPTPVLQEVLQQLTHVSAPGRASASTDDEGKYRLFGIAPGRYVVSTTLSYMDGSATGVTDHHGGDLPLGGREQAYPEVVPVYEPGVFRRRDARVFEIRAEEQAADADLTLDPQGLHTLRGKVSVEGEHHAPGGAMILLMEDGARSPVRFVTMGSDGSFVLNYLPSGSYTLQITASDNDTSVLPGQPKQARFYRRKNIPVVVGEQDVFLPDVIVGPLKPGERMEW